MSSAPTIRDTLDVKREPVPSRTFSKAYWDASRDKKLVLQYDPKTRRYQHFPRPASIVTGHRDLEWREVSGKGEVFSYTIARRTREPFAGHEPFFIVMVTLEEGVNVMGNMVGCAHAEMKIGLRVKPYWAPLSNGTHLLMFQPDR
jgi:uncharacterized OB-fold protein